MRPSENPQLPPEYRFRADLTACLIGIISLPLSALLVHSAQRGLPPSIAVLLLIIGLASLAGFAAVSKINSALDRVQIVHLVRAGARAGVLTALLGAAMTVFAARLFVSQPAALISVVPAALSILPAAFFGMLIAALAAGVRLPALPNASDSSPEPASGFLPLIPVLIIACAIGFLSALIPQSPPRAPRHSAQVDPGPGVRSSSPSWRYEKPAELATAEAARWQVSSTKSLGRIAADSPLALSRAGDLLAYFDPDRANVLKIVDLNAPDHFSSVPLPDPAHRIAFSPDGQHLIFATDKDPRLGVIDLTNSQTVFLPRPKDSAIPEGDLVWLTATQLVFQSDKPPVQILDLDSLEVTDAKTSSAWRSLTESDRTRLSSAPRIYLPATAHCVFEFRPAIESREVSDDPTNKEWSLPGNSLLSVKDLGHAYRQFFAVDAALDDRFLGAADASKLIRVRQNDLLVAYFAIRPAPELTFQLAMSKPPDEHGEKDKVAAALSAHTLCALVYPPLLNPLNQKTVGPDRARVKGLVRFSSWSGTQASVWLAEEFYPIYANDVIADLHVWKDNRPEPITDSDPKRWWSNVGSLTDEQRKTTGVPADRLTAPLERTPTYYLATDAGSLVLQKIDSQTSAKAAPTPSDTVTPPPASTPEVVQERARALSPNESAYQMVAGFIAEHHSKANRGDLNGLVSDYADHVVYFKNGTVDRSFIFRDESISRTRFRTVSESIIYPITIGELSQHRYQAHYQITYDGFKKDNRRVNGTSDVYLLLETTPYGLRIVSQQSKL